MLLTRRKDDDGQWNQGADGDNDEGGAIKIPFQFLGSSDISSSS